MNRRERVRMSEADAWQFLRQPNVATVCTLNPDLTIHAVALFYGFLDGRLAIHTKAKSQKVRNVLRNPTITLLAEAGQEYTELRGVQVVGRATVFDDPALTRTLSADMNGRYGWNRQPDDIEQARKLHNRVVIAIDVDRLVSWNHRRLTD
jgi:PPOX class probable F420-dependent enzyme